MMSPGRTPQAMTVVCMALIALALGTPDAWAARKKKPVVEQPPLTTVGQQLETRYADMLAQLQADIAKALPTLDQRKKAAFVDARAAEKAAEAALATAQQNVAAIHQAQGLVNHAKDKWIGGAEKGITDAEAKLKKATTQAERDALQKELAKHRESRAAGVEALKERQAALNKLKREEPRLKRELEAAKQALDRAKADTLAAVKGLNLGSVLKSARLDGRLAKFVLLREATPRGLAAFAQEDKQHAQLVERLLADSDLMVQMVTADGAKSGRDGVSHYGQAMAIYTDIQRASMQASSGNLQRLALAIALEHAVPIAQRNPKAQTDGPATVDPVKRYLHFEKAYLDGELDPGFKGLSVWDYRMVVDGSEPDEALAWGREMLRNYRPDHVTTSNYRWRYVDSVRTEIRYGSQDNKYDRDDLHFFQNILMNGGVCGRRAFFGRFILRAFGVPTIQRPQRGHAALAHWTPDGWVICLGATWGHGWVANRQSDLDFLAITQARASGMPYMQVKRAQWIGDVMDEDRAFGFRSSNPGFWNSVALYTQVGIIEDAKAKNSTAAGADIAGANETGKAIDIVKVTVTEAEGRIRVDRNGVITIPAAAASKPTSSTGKIRFMESVLGGRQLHYSRSGGQQAFEYTFDAPAAGKYALTARVVTPSWKQFLFVSANGAAKPVSIALPFTVGMWDETKPVEVTLVKGRNVLRFTREHENLKGVTIKDFTLRPVN